MSFCSTSPCHAAPAGSPLCACWLAYQARARADPAALSDSALAGSSERRALAVSLWSQAVSVCGTAVSVYSDVSQARRARAPPAEVRERLERLAHLAVQLVLRRLRDWGRTGRAQEGETREFVEVRFARVWWMKIRTCRGVEERGEGLGCLPHPLSRAAAQLGRA